MKKPNLLTTQPLKTIRNFIKNFDLNFFTRHAKTFDSADVADVLESLDEPNRLQAFHKLDPEKAVDVFEYLELDNQKQLLAGLTNAEKASVLNKMSPDDRTALFASLPGLEITNLMSLLTEEERKQAQDLLGYPEDSVGRIMNTDFIRLSPEMTIAEANDVIMRQGIDSESINVVYVCDEKGKLIDDIPLRRLFLNERTKTIGDIMDHTFIALNGNDRNDDAVTMFKEYDRVALPVVNNDGYILGVVTVDDVLDVAEKRDTAEIQRFGGVEELDYPYVKTPFVILFRKRAGWLILLFLGEMLTATAMGYFDNELSKAIVLALFIPLIISSGGNSGSQAATLIIRAMALKELTFKDWWYVMRREILSGLSLGIILGSIGLLRISIWQTFHWIDYGPHWWLVAMTIFFSLIGVVMWGTLSGSMIPIILKRLKFDPAASSAPLVATLVDVTGLVIYFTIAAIILKGTLL
ncbi:MAG TPA: magnesium transporter [Chitinophagaceae bacterium]|nr:magnesium transporter [Chitinophagaceae bacterium]